MHVSLLGVGEFTLNVFQKLFLGITSAALFSISSFGYSLGTSQNFTQAIILKKKPNNKTTTTTTNKQKHTNSIVFICQRISFILRNSVNPDEMWHYAAFHLGLHCLQNFLA